MFLSVGKQVLYLKRIKIGLLELDPALCPGECRLLQESELETIFLPDPALRNRGGPDDFAIPSRSSLVIFTENNGIFWIFTDLPKLGPENLDRKHLVMSRTNLL